MTTFRARVEGLTWDALTRITTVPQETLKALNPGLSAPFPVGTVVTVEREGFLLPGWDEAMHPEPDAMDLVTDQDDDVFEPWEES